MNSELPNSPEDRLLDELLREQAHGPDEAFLQQIEKAVDAGPPAANKLPTPRNYRSLGIAAGVGLAAGIAFFYHLQDRDARKSLVAMRQQSDAKADKVRERQELDKAIRDQEGKVEERRKALATIVRTKGIIDNGQDSFYGKSGVDSDQSAGVPSQQLAQNDPREESMKRGLDAQDYGDAKREFENDEQQLQEMKQNLATLRGERTEIASDAMAKKKLAGIPQEMSKRVYAEGATATYTIPEQGDNFGEISVLSSLDGGVMSGGLGRSGSGKGSGSGAGLGSSGAKDKSITMNAYPSLPAEPRVTPPSAGVAGQGTTRDGGGSVGRRGDRVGTDFAVPGDSGADRSRGATAFRDSDGFRLPSDAVSEQTSGDRYGAFVDQPWKAPDRDPLSTFSIDVDTASYANVRRMIREGREIPKDAVRIEEFINAFKYHYESPKGEGPFAVGASLAVCPWAPDHQLVRVSIKGREIEPGKRPASNLVFLIDVSGSMQSPDKLPLLKQSMQTMVSQLDERDRVAIVVYAGSEGVALPSTRLDEEGRAKVVNALAKLEAGGSTNGGAGIKRAYELAMEQKIQGGVNRVILATDGDFNVGVTGQESLVELVKDRAKSGVYLTVAGFGSGNLNDAMMDAITRDGNGNYFYIDSEREGRKVFLQNLAGTLVTIAKDVKIQVEFNPAKVGSYRLIGYANRVLKNEDFNNDKVDAGDIGAGHTVTTFYELTPVGAATGTDGLKYQAAAEKPAATDEWLTVKLRHKHPEGDESSKIEFPLTGDPAPLDKADCDFQFATAAALLGMKIRGMDEARGMSWEQLIALAKPGLANDATEDRAEFVELIKKLAGHERPKPAPAEVVPVDRSR